jgi:hypothetical protein
MVLPMNFQNMGMSLEERNRDILDRHVLACSNEIMSAEARRPWTEGGVSGSSPNSFRGKQQMRGVQWSTSSGSMQRPPPRERLSRAAAGGVRNFGRNKPQLKPKVVVVDHHHVHHHHHFHASVPEPGDPLKYDFEQRATELAHEAEVEHAAAVAAPLAESRVETAQNSQGKARQGQTLPLNEYFTAISQMTPSARLKFSPYRGVTAGSSRSVIYSTRH